MELLIELIVWMFKAFFGDPEKTVDTSKLNRKPPLRPPQRGPYNYGDSPPSNAPKTLEEILEEARRQAAERRGELARPPQPPRPAPLARNVPDAAPPPVRTIVATPLEDDEPRPFQPVSQAPRPAPQPQRQPVPQQRQRPTRQAPTLVVQQPEMASSIPAPPPEAPRPARAASKKKESQPQVYAVPDLLQAIRTAPPIDKRDAARQAVVMLEIFGPPRSRRGVHRPGARSF